MILPNTCSHKREEHAGSVASSKCKVAGGEGYVRSVTTIAEQLSALLRSGGVAEQRARTSATTETLRAQLLAVGEALFQHGQLGLVPGLTALAGPLQDDPVLLFLQVRSS